MEIRIQNISFSYDQDTVINALTTRFRPGIFHAVLGPNGCGKTTLMDIISGFLKPDRGSLFIGNRKISRLSKPRTAKLISLVSQNYTIGFPFTVKQVVMMGRHPHIGRFSRPSRNDYKKVDQAMEDTGISHLKNRKITQLSGGEKQRCVVARSLCQDTPVLLLDEAFSNLDICHTLNLLDLMKNRVLNPKKIIVSVLHDLNLAAAWADEMLFLKQGRLISQGGGDKVLTEKNIKEVFDVESKVEFNEHVQAKQVYYTNA